MINNENLPLNITLNAYIPPSPFKTRNWEGIKNSCIDNGTELSTYTDVFKCSCSISYLNGQFMGFTSACPKHIEYVNRHVNVHEL